MSKHIFKIICVGSLLFLAFLPLRALADPFLPSWQVGKKWLVKAIYPSPVNEDEWSGPLYWEYKIVGREVHGSQNLYILEVKDQKGALQFTTRLSYNCEDLSLSRVEIPKRRRDGQFVKILDYERGAPVWTEQTLTPFDTPVFPLHSPSSIDFSVTRQVSQGLKENMTIRQEIKQVYEVKELPDWPSQKALIEVKCTRDHGSLIFVQYWDRNLPWPVYGQNRNMRYWLVQE